MKRMSVRAFKNIRVHSQDFNEPIEITADGEVRFIIIAPEQYEEMLEKLKYAGMAVPVKGQIIKGKVIYLE